MKLTDISQLTDENLKECKASAIVELLNEEIKKADTKWKEEELKAKNAEADKKLVEANLAQIQADLKKLQDAAAAKEAEETFNQRMTYFDDTYELSKEERQAIAAEVKDADKDSFEKAKSKFDIFLKDKSKAAIKAKNDEIEAAKKKVEDDEDTEDMKDMTPEEKKKMKDKMKKEKMMKASASTEDQKVIDEALKNGTQANAALPNAQSSEQTLEAKYAEYFKPENCIEISKR